MKEKKNNKIHSDDGDVSVYIANDAVVYLNYLRLPMECVYKCAARLNN